MIERLFIDFSIKKLEQLTSRIRDCLGRLDREQIWRRSGDHDNAVGNLVLHLCGNVGQWIVSGVGGKPDIRVRDREFGARGDVDAAELMNRLEGTVAEAVSVLRELESEELLKTVKPQNYEIPAVEAIYHVVEHFAQHTGQIIFATKLLTGLDLGYYKHLNKAAHGEKTP